MEIEIRKIVRWISNGFQITRKTYKTVVRYSSKKKLLETVWLTQPAKNLVPTHIIWMNNLFENSTD